MKSDNTDDKSTDSLPTKVLREYFHIYDEYVKKYGNKIVVVMEVGTFYELRGAEENGDCSGEHIRDLSAKLHLKAYFSGKNNSIAITASRSNPICIGFPSSEGDPYYIPKIVDAGYWAVIAKEVDITPSGCKTKLIERKVVQVVNKATLMNEEFLSDCSVTKEQNLLVVYAELVPYRKIVSMGMSCMNIDTGRIDVFNGLGTMDDKNRTFEDLERWICRYRPRQIVWTSDSDELLIQWQTQYSAHGIEIVKFSRNPKFENLNNQEQLLRQYFFRSNTTELITNATDALGLSEAPNARLSLMYLIQYLHDTSKEILHGMLLPTFENNKTSFLLENNAIKQLHVHEFCDDILRCQTMLGKRLLRERMTNPSSDVATINKWLDYAESCDIQLNLRSVCRLDMVVRRMAMGKSIFMGDLTYLIEALTYLDNMSFSESMKKSESSFQWNIGSVLRHLKSVFNLTSGNICIFRDRFVKEQEDFLYLEGAKQYFVKELNELLHSQQTNRRRDDTNTTYVTAKETKQEGLIFIGNKSNVPDNLTKESLVYPVYVNSVQLEDDDNIPQHHDAISSLTSKFICWNKDTVTVKIIGGKRAFIHNELSKLYSFTRSQLCALMATEFKSEMQNTYDVYETTFQETLTNLARLDLAMATHQLATNSRYVRPEISRGEENVDNNPGSSFLVAKNLRHPIIEKKLVNSVYIPNDFELTSYKPGLVIYGMNSGGKSSALRSVGLSVVMSQAGLFVPASSFRLAPFDNLLTRIMGGDDMMRGTSSFVMEMLELKPVATRATDRTLVLGDEICHSTENKSGTAIVSAFIDHMATEKIKFIIVTHMRALEKLTNTLISDNVSHKYIHVGTDSRSGQLIFDRNLRDGTGPDTYGITVAEHVGIPSSIIMLAHKKLKIINGVPDSCMKISKYDHRKVHLPFCSIEGCNNVMEEEDHIVPQWSADERGYVSMKNTTAKIPKHHPSNLQGLCKACHSKKTKCDMNLKRMKREKEKNIITASPEIEPEVKRRCINNTNKAVNQSNLSHYFSFYSEKQVNTLNK